jgi:hypothetical protein
LGYNWTTTRIRESEFLSVKKNAGVSGFQRRNRKPENEAAEYFETKEAAEHFIAEHRKTGSIHLAELSVE